MRRQRRIAERETASRGLALRPPEILDERLHIDKELLLIMNAAGFLFQTPRLLLRPFVSEDAPALHEILGDRETMAYCEPPYTLEQTRRFLADFCIKRQGALAAVRKDNGLLTGYILFKPIDKDVYEIGWIFRRDCWRQGYAYEACSGVIDRAFRVLGAHKLLAETIDPGKSVPLMEKLGMLPEGIQRSQVRDLSGNWADLYLYGILSEDWKRHGIKMDLS